MTASIALVACSQETSDSPDLEAVAAVRETVKAFFAALREGDRADMNALILEEGMGFAVRPDRGEAAGSRPSGRPLAATVRDLAASEGDIVERIWDAEVRVAELPGANGAAIATLWAPYDFWLDGAFQHCGVDAFQLVRTGGQWRIANVVYTAHSENCPESPLGPVSE